MEPNVAKLWFKSAFFALSLVAVFLIPKLRAWWQQRRERRQQPPEQ